MVESNKDFEKKKMEEYQKDFLNLEMKWYVFKSVLGEDERVDFDEDELYRDEEKRKKLIPFINSRMNFLRIPISSGKYNVPNADEIKKIYGHRITDPKKYYYDVTKRIIDIIVSEKKPISFKFYMDTFHDFIKGPPPGSNYHLYLEEIYMGDQNNLNIILETQRKFVNFQKKLIDKLKIVSKTIKIDPSSLQFFDIKKVKYDYWFLTTRKYITNILIELKKKNTNVEQIEKILEEIDKLDEIIKDEKIKL